MYPTIAMDARSKMEDTDHARGKGQAHPHVTTGPAVSTVPSEIQRENKVVSILDHLSEFPSRRIS